MPQTNKRLKAAIGEIGSAIDLVSDSKRRLIHSRDPNEYTRLFTTLLGDINLLENTYSHIEEEVFASREQAQQTPPQTAAQPAGGFDSVIIGPGGIIHNVPVEQGVSYSDFHFSTTYTPPPPPTPVRPEPRPLPTNAFRTTWGWSQNPAQPAQVQPPTEEDAPPWLTIEGDQIPPERPR